MSTTPGVFEINSVEDRRLASTAYIKAKKIGEHMSRIGRPETDRDAVRGITDAILSKLEASRDTLGTYRIREKRVNKKLMDIEDRQDQITQSQAAVISHVNRMAAMARANKDDHMAAVRRESTDPAEEVGAEFDTVEPAGSSTDPLSIELVEPVGSDLCPVWVKKSKTREGHRCNLQQKTRDATGRLSCRYHSGHTRQAGVKRVTRKEKDGAATQEKAEEVNRLFEVGGR